MKLPLPIRDFRYKVRFTNRTDVNAIDQPSVTIDGTTETMVHLDEHFDDMGYVYAAIKPISTQTFYENVQTEWEFTHKIYIRWLNKAWDQTVTIFNDVILDNGDIFTERYKVIRAANWQGRKTCVVIDARLEEMSEI